MKVSSSLLEEVIYISHSGEGTFDPDRGLWNVGPLGKGESASLIINTRLGEPAARNPTVDAKPGGVIGDELIISASITSSDQGNPNASDNTSTVNVRVQRADLSVRVSSSDARPKLGDEVSYTIAVANQGADDATGVKLNALLPDGISYVSHNGDGMYDPNGGL